MVLKVKVAAQPAHTLGRRGGSRWQRYAFMRRVLSSPEDAHFYIRSIVREKKGKSACENALIKLYNASRSNPYFCFFQDILRAIENDKISLVHPTAHAFIKDILSYLIGREHPRLYSFFCSLLKKPSLWRSSERIGLLLYVYSLSSEQKSHFENAALHCNLSLLLRIAFLSGSRRGVHIARCVAEYGWPHAAIICAGGGEKGRKAVEIIESLKNFKGKEKLFLWLNIFSIYPEYLPEFELLCKALSSSRYRELRYSNFSLPSRLKESWLRNLEESEEKLTLLFTDDFDSIFSMGRTPYINTCLSYDSKRKEKIALLGFLLNPWFKLFAVKERDVLLARAFCFLVGVKEGHAAVIEGFAGNWEARKRLERWIENVAENWLKEGLIAQYRINEWPASAVFLKPFRAPIYAEYKSGGFLHFPIK